MSMFGAGCRVNASLLTAAHARSKLLRVYLVIEPRLRRTVLILNQVQINRTDKSRLNLFGAASLLRLEL